MTALEKYVETMEHPLVVIHPEHGNIDVVDMKVTPENIEKIIGGIGTLDFHETSIGNVVVFEREKPLELGLPINMNMLPFFYVGTVVVSVVSRSKNGIMFPSTPSDKVYDLISWVMNNQK